MKQHVKSVLLYWRYAKNVLRSQGGVALLHLLLRKFSRLRGHYYRGFYDFGYQTWSKRHRELCMEIPMGENPPTVSIIVPVYNVDARWIEQTIDSVRTQSYQNWQLCLVNDNATDTHIKPLLDGFAAEDARIQVHHNTENVGIAGASNIGLEMANGEFIALLDHDDLLAPYALSVFSHYYANAREAELFYSDEDKIDADGNFSAPFFKPDFSPELLQSQNYIGHLVCIKRELLNDIGGFSAGVDGAQDYDLMLRACSRGKQIVHIPHVLYHWRQIPGSTAMSFGEKNYAWDAGKRALENHYNAEGKVVSVSNGEVPGTYRSEFPINNDALVSIIIPFKDRPELLQQCIDSVLTHTNWQNFEIIAVDNQSTDPKINDLKHTLPAKDSRIRFLSFDQPFNFAAICNYGVAEAKGEFIVLLNNDVKITAQGWLEALLQYAQQIKIGAVGATLFYPNQTIQHAGITIGIGGTAGHTFKHFGQDQIGYFGRLKICHNVSAVTAALLMVSRQKYLEVGGLDETDFAIAFNDVDFCLKLIDKGYRNVVTPFCHGIHYESTSRGLEHQGKNWQRFENEQERFKTKWQTLIAAGDPYYNRNLTRDSEDYSII